MNKKHKEGVYWVLDTWYKDNIKLKLNDEEHKFVLGYHKYPFLGNYTDISFTLNNKECFEIHKLTNKLNGMFVRKKELEIYKYFKEWLNDNNILFDERNLQKKFRTIIYQ